MSLTPDIVIPSMIVGGVDVFRLVALVIIGFATGATVVSVVRFTSHLLQAPPEYRRLWIARLAVRLAFLGLLYFALDTTLQYWGEPVRVRTIVLIITLGFAPWAMNELTADVLRLPGAARRQSDARIKRDNL